MVPEPRSSGCVVVPGFVLPASFLRDDGSGGLNWVFGRVMCTSIESDERTHEVENVHEMQLDRS